MFHRLLFVRIQCTVAVWVCCVGPVVFCSWARYVLPTFDPCAALSFLSVVCVILETCIHDGQNT